MRSNVVLLVLDTLREDHAQGLRKLEDIGFTRYENAISASNWTVPSHASIFTGRLPSSHGIHESLNVYADNPAKLTSANLSVQERGILGKLARSGYQTASLTANPLVSTLFGFPFGRCDIFDEVGPVDEMNRYLKQSGGSWLRASIRMVRDMKAGTLLRRVYQHARAKAPRALYRNPREKGSKHIIAALESWKPQEPFLLYVNLMEAHQPYSWNDRSPGSESTYCYLTGKKFLRDFGWPPKYRRLADLAVARGLEVVDRLQRSSKDTLFIVTSDHGQLLGESGRYDHGYFLDDALLRVPLYVRYPEGMQPLRQRGTYVSTCEIPLIVESTLYDARAELGSQWAEAESYGPPWNVLKYAQNEQERGVLESAYRRRVKVYGQQGSFILEPRTGAIEEMQDGATDEEVAGYLKMKVSSQVPKPR